MRSIARITTYTALIAMLAFTSACGSKQDTTATPAPLKGSLRQTLDMTDKDGKHYGTVEMNPIGGGRVLDADGQVIGKIVPVKNDD
jgi:hypothetical protein